MANAKYGDRASAVNVSSKNRNERYGIVITVPGGALSDPLLGCLGFGDSFQAAWDMAEKNEAAQKIA